MRGGILNPFLRSTIPDMLRPELMLFEIISIPFKASSIGRGTAFLNSSDTIGGREVVGSLYNKSFILCTNALSDNWVNIFASSGVVDQTMLAYIISPSILLPPHTGNSAMGPLIGLKPLKCYLIQVAINSNGASKWQHAFHNQTRLLEEFQVTFWQMNFLHLLQWANLCIFSPHCHLHQRLSQPFHHHSLVV